MLRLLLPAIKYSCRVLACTSALLPVLQGIFRVIPGCQPPRRSSIHSVHASTVFMYQLVQHICAYICAVTIFWAPFEYTGLQ